MMKTMIETPTRALRTMAVAAAMVLAGLLLALAGTAHEAEATFPGDNGKIAFASNRTVGEGVNNPEGDLEIFTMNRDGVRLTQLTENAAFDFDPEWSSDGERIVFESRRDSFSEIFVMHADGTEQKKVTTNPDFSFDRAPAFSPDGERVAFMSNQDGPTNIYTMDVNGSGQQRLTDNGTGKDTSPAFSPNGKEIAFSSNRDSNFEIYKMLTDGTGPVNLTNDPAGDFTPDWQPLKKRH